MVSNNYPSKKQASEDSWLAARPISGFLQWQLGGAGDRQLMEMR